ncbi:MAG: tetratricopeptide repeat protein, partial [Thermodesulfobacteriota bacterium]
GKIYDELNDRNKALRFYNRALMQNPYFSPTYNNIASLLDKEGKYELAHKYLIKGIRLSPNSNVINYNLGLYYLRKRQPEQANPHLRNVSANKEFAARLPLHLGIAYKQKAQLGRAIAYFKRAVKINPRNIKTYLHLAETFYRVGDKRQAREYAAKAVNTMPNKQVFQQIIDAIQKEDRSRNLQPRADIVIPLMKEACLNKSETLKEWSKLLKEKTLELKGGNNKSK